MVSEELTREGMERLRILYHSPHLTLGGTERQLQYLATGLSADFEALVWCSGPSGPVGERLRSGGIEIFHQRLSAWRPDTFAYAVALLRRLKPHVFHSMDYGPHWIDVAAAGVARVPICVTSRGNVRHWSGGDRLHLSERIRNQHTHLVVANCRAVAECCHRIEKISWDRIRVVPIGTPLPTRSQTDRIGGNLRFDRGELLIGNVANLKRVKGQDYLLRAFQAVAKHVPRARLLICGEGKMRRQLEFLRDELGLGERVTFLGALSNPEPLYSSVDLYVHSSLAEGMPNAITEAMAHRLPVVATSVGGIPDVVLHDVTGLLVRPGNSEALAAALLKLCRGMPAARKMGLAGHERFVSHFTLSRMVEAHEKLYAELAERVLGYGRNSGGSPSWTGYG